MASLGEKQRRRQHPPLLLLEKKQSPDEPDHITQRGCATRKNLVGAAGLEPATS